MKFIAAITTAVVLTFGAPAQAQQQPSAEACHKAAEIVGIIGEMRENQEDPRHVVMGLIQSGLPPHVANSATFFVYETHGDKPVDEVQEIFLGNCLGDPI
jgi:hypothetical protein